MCSLSTSDFSSATTAFVTTTAHATPNVVENMFLRIPIAIMVKLNGNNYVLWSALSYVYWCSKKDWTS